MSRILLAAGATLISLGIGLTFPAFIGWLEHDELSEFSIPVLGVAATLMLCGTTLAIFGVRHWRTNAMPAPVRAVVAANAIFLAFCALELSDGLIRNEGRVFYWTTVLFAPALVLHFGLIVGQRWAWLVARALAALAVLWFAVFLVLVPFADLHGPDGPIPWWGRVYTALVTIAFASMFAYAFRALGRDESRLHFGLAARLPEPPTNATE